MWLSLQSERPVSVVAARITANLSICATVSSGEENINAPHYLIFMWGGDHWSSIDHDDVMK